MRHTGAFLFNNSCDNDCGRENKRDNLSQKSGKKHYPTDHLNHTDNYGHMISKYSDYRKRPGRFGAVFEKFEIAVADENNAEADPYEKRRQKSESKKFRERI